MAIYLLIANSVVVVYSTTKFLNLSHAIIITLGAYFTYLFSGQWGLPLSVALLCSVVCAVITGFLFEITIFQPLRKKEASSFVLLIASLGIYVIMQNVISMIWGNDTRTIRTWEKNVGNKIWGAYITNIQILIIVVSILFFVATFLFLNYSKTGKNIRAVSSNKMLSDILGINSDKVIISSIVLGSVLSSISGILVAFNTDFDPTMGFNLLLYGIVAMIIGGVENIWGLIGGSLLLAAAQHLGAYYIDSKWMDAIAYIILILFLIWKPLGFSGKRLKKVEI